MRKWWLVGWFIGWMGGVLVLDSPPGGASQGPAGAEPATSAPAEPAEGLQGRIVGRYYWDGRNRLEWMLPAGWDFGNPPRPAGQGWLLRAAGPHGEAELACVPLEVSAPLPDAADSDAQSGTRRWLDGYPLQWRGHEGYQIVYREVAAGQARRAQALWLRRKQRALILRVTTTEEDATMLAGQFTRLLNGLRVGREEDTPSEPRNYLGAG